MRLADALIGISSLLFLAVPVHSRETTYWIDSSCDKHLPAGMLEKMMKEATDTALMIRDRMSRTSKDEPDAHRAFESLFKFKFDTSDPEDKKHVDTFKSRFLSTHKSLYLTNQL